MGITVSSKQPSKISQAYEEPETAINPRTLTKATAPPVTIRNFFKPKTAPLEFDEGTSEDKREIGVENESVFQECSLKTDTKEEVERSEVPTTKQTMSGASKKEIKSIYFNSNGAKTQERTQQKGSLEEGGVRCNSIARHFTEPPSKENLKGKKSLKRTSSDLSLRTGKRQKQLSILCSFGKGTEKKNQNVKKEIFCPVCGVKFASEAKNVDINEHIDGCLVE